jgi:hypothetical protein
LLIAYLDQLLAAGVPGVHLGTTTLNRAALHLYCSLGFQVLAARRSRMWQGLIVEPLENLCLGLVLTESDRVPLLAASPNPQPPSCYRE